ncbi:MAG: hypothetical protein MR018_08940 [Clostridiales bacterium]|nr:hypothetical protein [Clostridiales bacterium]
MDRIICHPRKQVEQGFLDAANPKLLLKNRYSFRLYRRIQACITAVSDDLLSQTVILFYYIRFGWGCQRVFHAFPIAGRKKTDESHRTLSENML